MSESAYRRKKSFSLKKVFIHALLIIGVLFTVFPFIWMMITSLKTNAESIMVPMVFFPKVPQWGNYGAVLKTLPYGSFYYNTVVSTVVKTASQLLLCSMAAYAFARIEFPHKNKIFILVLSVLMVPSQIYILPQYLIIKNLKLLNTLSALIIPGLFSAFGTFLLRQFFMSIPKELDEAAIIDGCNHFQIYWHILMPLAKPGLTALAIFTALYCWNDLMWPLMVNNSVDKLTLSAGLALLQGQHYTNYPKLMAGSLLAIWPMIVIFMIFQKAFVEGIALTGSKN